MSDIDLMIRILTDANTQGLAQTEKSLDDLNGAMRENTTAAEVSSGALTGLRGKLGDVGDMSKAAARAARGDLGGALRELVGLSNSASSGLMTVGGVAGAALMGFQLGRLIDDATGLSDALGRLAVPADAAGNALRHMSEARMDELRRNLEGIEQVDLSAITNELKSGADSSRAFADNTQKMLRTLEALEKARVRERVAKGEISSEEGSLREANITASFSEKGLDAKQKALDAQLAAAQKSRESADAVRRDLENRRDAAGQSYLSSVNSASGVLTPEEIAALGPGAATGTAYQALVAARERNAQSIRTAEQRARVDPGTIREDGSLAPGLVDPDKRAMLQQAVEVAKRNAEMLDAIHAAATTYRRLENEAAAAADNASQVRASVDEIMATVQEEAQRIAIERETIRTNSSAATAGFDRTQREQANQELARAAELEARAAAAQQEAQRQQLEDRLRIVEQELRQAQSERSKAEPQFDRAVEKERQDVEEAEAAYRAYKSKPDRRLGAAGRERELVGTIMQQQQELQMVQSGVSAALSSLDETIRNYAREVKNLQQLISNLQSL